jgi:Protein of unknown function (DUF3455)
LSHPVSAADHIRQPSVPVNLQVPAGNKVFLEGDADGTQDYICLPCPNVITTAAMCPDSGFAWAFFGPQATLFNPHSGQQIITHFLSPNPDPMDPMGVGTPRATWQHSRDTSKVWAVAVASSSDPNFVAAGAIPWLLLQVVGAEPGISSYRLMGTTYIQRLSTAGGVAPMTTEGTMDIVGTKALVPYTAHYFFYKATGDDH